MAIGDVRPQDQSELL
jgi:hypothetical protein